MKKQNFMLIKFAAFIIAVFAVLTLTAFACEAPTYVTVAILPSELCKADTVQYLYDRQVGVWASISDAPDAAEIFIVINSGAIGVVSDDTDGVLNAAMLQMFP